MVILDQTQTELALFRSEGGPRLGELDVAPAQIRRRPAQQIGSQQVRVLTVGRHALRQHPVEPQGPPQEQPEANVTKVSGTLNPGIGRADLHLLRHEPSYDPLVEEWQTGLRSMTRNAGHVDPSRILRRMEFAQVHQQLVTRAPSRTRRLDQGPVSLTLAVLANPNPFWKGTPQRFC